MLYDAPIFRLMGDRSLLIELGDEISPSVNQRVQELFTAMDMQRVGGVRELVPSYRSLLVVYDPLSISADVLKRSIRDICQRIDQADLDLLGLAHEVTCHVNDHHHLDGFYYLEVGKAQPDPA